MAVPLVVRETLVGVVRLSSIKKKDEDFTSGDETLLESLASRLAFPIQNIWLKDQSQARLDHLTAFDRLGQRLAETLDLDEVGRIILEEGLKILRCDLGHIRLFEKESASLRVLAVSGARSDQPKPVRPLGESVSGKVGQERQPYVVNDCAADQTVREKFKHHPAGSFLHSVRSLACFPLVVQKDLIGTLMLHSTRVNAFGSEELQLLWDLTNRGAVAIRAALMFHEIDSTLKHHIEALERIRTMGMNFVQTVNLEELLRRVLEAALKESRMSWGTLRTPDERGENWILQAALDQYGRAVGSNSKPEIPSSLDLVQEASSQADPTWLPDAQNDSRFQRFKEYFGDLPNHRGPLETTRSLLVIPMRLREECLGLIFLCSSIELPAADEKVLGYLQILATEAAVALNNGRLFAQLQRSLTLAEPLAMVGAVHGGFLHQMRAGLQRMLDEINLAELERLDGTIRNRIKACRQHITGLQSVLKDVELFALRGSTAVREPVDINATIERALSDNRTRFNDKIRVDFTVRADGAVTLGNRVQIQLAFGLVVGNAVEAMHDDGLLTIETRTFPDVVQVHFRDTGMGMTTAVLSRLGNPFFTTKRDGSGLGVSIIKRILSRHGGTIQFESVRGHGTSVTLEFPRRKD